MSNYIVSARKYRPKTFKDVVGQEALTHTLCNAIDSGKLAHAYLFCGPRGVGKTTCARIFAKTINCEHRDENGEACGICDSCHDFDEGRSLSIHELDAASNNSVENIRDLIEQVRIPPQVGRYKVFIIDEVHMLSSGAFNAFLKTLEEPPSYVIFILATTEKQKIIPTILSRCQIYDFKSIGTDDIMNQLLRIAQAENITCEPEALRVIAEKADGGMRDALSIFDQQVIFTEGNVTYENVIRNLNILDVDSFFSVTDFILKHDVSNILLALNDILLRGFEGNTFIGGLAKHFRSLLVCMDVVTIPLLGMSEKVAKRFGEQAAHCTREFLYKAMKLCNDCDLNYRNSRNKRLLVEITLIEIVQTAVELGTGDSEGSLSPASNGNDSHKSLNPIFRDTQKKLAQTQNEQSSVKVAGQASKTTDSVEDKASSSVSSAKPTEGKNIDVTKSQTTISSNTNVIKSIVSIRGMLGNISDDEKKEDSHGTSMGEKQHDENNVGNDPIEEARFAVEWLRFANGLPAEESDMAGRMKAMKPHISTDGTLDITVENQQVERFMQPMIPRLEQFLQHNLNNRNVHVSLHVKKDTEVQPVLSSAERFRKMMNTNKALSKLNDYFEFEIV